MATRKPRWVETKEIKVDPNYPEYTITGETERYTFLYTGPYLSLIAAKPGRGSVVSGYAGYTVSDVKVKPSGAGVDGPGVMMFSIERVNGGGAIGSDEDQTVVEIDAGSLDKSLLMHPRFKNIDKADIAKLKKALDNNETVPGPTLPGPVVQELQELYDLMSRGQESYLVLAPIVRITTTGVNKPEVGQVGVGTRSTEKPHPSAPSGYVWLTTADRATQTGSKGKWERIKEVSGADDWPAVVYGPQPPPAP